MPNQELKNDLFLKACRRQPTSRTPIWIMRQAGRYLPEYRAVRAKVDFLTLCKTPELAAEVTVQPIDIIGVDAAIIFSDILVVPEAMGMKLIVEEGRGGPRFPTPIANADDVRNLKIPNPAKSLKYVYDAIALTQKSLNGRVPLIGFCGSPWTLAAYMVEGSGARDFRKAKKLLYDNPKLAHELLAKLATSVAKHLSAQIAAGAQAVQIFDTWGGTLTPDAFREFSLRYIQQVVSEIERNDEPVIVFCKGCGQSLDAIAATGCDVVGLDWTTDIGSARKQIGSRVALQGNLDPAVLHSSSDAMRTEVRSILKKYGNGPGHIFNLGHGIDPEASVELVKDLIQTVKSESVSFHKAA